MPSKGTVRNTKTRRGAHTGSCPERRSRVPVSEGSSARKVDRTSRRGGIQNKFAVASSSVQGDARRSPSVMAAYRLGLPPLARGEVVARELTRTLQSQCGEYAWRAGQSIIGRSHPSCIVKAYRGGSRAHRWRGALFCVGILPSCMSGRRLCRQQEGW